MDISKLSIGLPNVDRSGPKVDIGVGKEHQAKNQKSVPFADILNDRLDPSKTVNANNTELKFSSHAKTRMGSRGIDLSAEDIVKLQDAIHKAGQKGSKESLILSDKGAFIVSVKNNTVITAVDKHSLKENIFTNIDSTIMI